MLYSFIVGRSSMTAIMGVYSSLDGIFLFYKCLHILYMRFFLPIEDRQLDIIARTCYVTIGVSFSKGVPGNITEQVPRDLYGKNI